MPLEEVYSIAGRGTEVTDRIWSEVWLERERKCSLSVIIVAQRLLLHVRGQDGNILSKEMYSVDPSQQHNRVFRPFSSMFVHANNIQQ